MTSSIGPCWDASHAKSLHLCRLTRGSDGYAPLRYPAPISLCLFAHSPCSRMYHHAGVMGTVLDRICGIVSHGSFHFTARPVDKTMNAYYYDGAGTGPECILEG